MLLQTGTLMYQDLHLLLQLLGEVSISHILSQIKTSIPTNSPRSSLHSLSALYTVRPAHIIFVTKLDGQQQDGKGSISVLVHTGAAWSRGMPDGMRTAFSALHTQYCWKVPSTVYPESWICGHSGWEPREQKPQTSQVLFTHCSNLWAYAYCVNIFVAFTPVCRLCHRWRYPWHPCQEPRLCQPPRGRLWMR